MNKFSNFKIHRCIYNHSPKITGFMPNALCN